MGVIVTRNQPQGLVRLDRSNKFVKRNIAFAYSAAGNILGDLATARVATGSGISQVVTTGGKAIGFPNAANQGVSFGTYNPFSGTKQTVLIVSTAQARSSQRNLVLCARDGGGAFIGASFNTKSDLAITSGAFSFSWFGGGVGGYGGYIPSAITGKTSAYAISRNSAVMSGAVDGQSKTVTLDSPNTQDLAAYTTTELQVGDLGNFSGTGYGAQDPVSLILVFNEYFSAEELAELTANPNQVFAAQQRTLFTVSAGGSLTYSYTATGGLTISGAAPAVRSRAKVPTGGLGLSGVAPASRGKAQPVPTGGLVLSGAALKASGRGVTPSGGVTLSGAAVSLRGAARTAAGGLLLSGSTATVRGKAHLPTGGIALTGAAAAARGRRANPTGGISLSGATAMLRGVARTASGGILFAGTAPVSFTSALQSLIVTPIGGFAIAGSAAIVRGCSRVATGGITLAGHATASFGSTFRRALIFIGTRRTQIPTAQLATGKKPLVLHVERLKVRATTEGTPIVLVDNELSRLPASDTLDI
jgi:hypothetical protein